MTSLMPLAVLGLEGLGNTVFGVAAAILGIGFLIFVHEAGHFLAAKWAGVRVLVFSLGFGHRLFGFKRGDTDYRVSLLPLGGYVQMLGQDDSDPDQPRTESPDDFRNKSVFRRMVILSAGVAMNATFAVILFILAFASGVEFTAPEVGTVRIGGAAEKAEVAGDPSAPKGLRRGDQIIALDGKQVLAFEDIQTLVALSGESVAIEVDRPTPSGPKRLTFVARPQRGDTDPFPLIGIDPGYGVSSIAADSPAAASGLKENDQIVAIAPVGSEALSEMKPDEMSTFVEANPGARVKLLVLRREFDGDGRPVKREDVRLETTLSSNDEYDLGLDFHDEPFVTGVAAASPAKGALELGDKIVSVGGLAATATNLRAVVHDAGEAAKDPKDPRHSLPIEVVIERRTKGAASELKLPIRLERRASEEGWLLGVSYGALRVKSVEPGSPAAGAGLRPDDRISYAKLERGPFGLFWRDSKPLFYGRRDLEELIRDRKGKELQLAWERPDGTDMKAVLGARKSDRKYGSLPDGFTVGPRQVMIRRGVAGSCSLGVDRTFRNTEQLLLTLRALVTRRVSGKEMGGPLKIGQVVYSSAQRGFGKLLYILALLSVNLAVLNILPIPVLDGGHLFLLTLEKLKGKPLSDSVLAYTQWVGLFLILGLMVAVTFNDVTSWFK